MYEPAPRWAEREGERKEGREIHQITQAERNRRATPRRRASLDVPATMLSVSDWPGWHWVPVAMACTADHSPDAQRWYESPPIQFHAPSSVHSVPAAKAPPPLPPALEVPVEPGAEAVAVVSEPELEPDELITVASVVACEVAPPLLPLEPSEVTKTPPGRELLGSCELGITTTGFTVRGIEGVLNEDVDADGGNGDKGDVE